MRSWSFLIWTGLYKEWVWTEKVCAVKGSKHELKDCFLANAKDAIFGATRDQLEAAYDECMDEDILVTQGHGQLEKLVGEMFRIIGNKAPNPNNEKLIESVWFGYV